jgi:hypothetical protein
MLRSILCSARATAAALRRADTAETAETAAGACSAAAA